MRGGGGPNPCGGGRGCMWPILGCGPLPLNPGGPLIPGGNIPGGPLNPNGGGLIPGGGGPLGPKGPPGPGNLMKGRPLILGKNLPLKSPRPPLKSPLKTPLKSPRPRKFCNKKTDKDLAWKDFVPVLCMRCTVLQYYSIVMATYVMFLGFSNLLRFWLFIIHSLVRLSIINLYLTTILIILNILFT